MTDPQIKDTGSWYFYARLLKFEAIIVGLGWTGSSYKYIWEGDSGVIEEKQRTGL